MIYKAVKQFKIIYICISFTENFFFDLMLVPEDKLKAEYRNTPQVIIEQILQGTYLGSL